MSVTCFGGILVGGGEGSFLRGRRVGTVILRSSFDNGVFLHFLSDVEALVAVDGRTNGSSCLFRIISDVCGGFFSLCPNLSPPIFLDFSIDFWPDGTVCFCNVWNFDWTLTGTEDSTWDGDDVFEKCKADDDDLSLVDGLVLGWSSTALANAFDNFLDFNWLTSWLSVLPWWSLPLVMVFVMSCPTFLLTFSFICFTICLAYWLGLSSTTRSSLLLKYENRENSKSSVLGLEFSLLIWSESRWWSTSDLLDDDLLGVSGKDCVPVLWRGSRRRRGCKRDVFEDEEGEWVSGSRSRPISLATKLGVLVAGEPLISEFDPVRPLVLIWIPIWIRALGGSTLSLSSSLLTLQFTEEEDYKNNLLGYLNLLLLRLFLL